jgi:hypothetical protein
MGYWSPHPFCGDTPYDYRDEMTDYGVERLIEDYLTSKHEDENIEISDIDKNVLRILDESGIENKEELCKAIIDTLYSNKKLEEQIWERYKYDILLEYYTSKGSFVIPFAFILYGIKVDKKYLPYIETCFRTTNWKERGYPEWDNKETYHPMYYASVAKQYLNELFDEDNHDLNDDFVIKHPEIVNVYPTGLLATMLGSININDKYNNLINTD